MNCLVQLNLLDWEMWSAIAAWIEIIILFIPIIGYIFYSKLNFANYWVLNQTSNGIDIAIHNKSKSSLFVLQEEICVKNSKGCSTYSLFIKHNSKINHICIKPDKIICISIDYEMYHILPSDQIILYIQYGGRKYRKKIKIKRGNEHVCESRKS